MLLLPKHLNRQNTRIKGALACALLIGVPLLASADTVHYEIRGVLAPQQFTTVPQEIDTYLQSNFNGKSFFTTLDLDTATADTDPSPSTADYVGAVKDSNMVIGGKSMNLSSYCNPEFDCKVNVRNDHSFGGTLRNDQYFMRSRLFSVSDLPQPSAGSFVHILSFIFSPSQFTTTGANPSLLDSTRIDPGLDRLISESPNSFTVHLQGYAVDGALREFNAMWQVSNLEVTQGHFPVSAVPEPASYAILLAGLGLIGTVARRRSHPSRV